MSFRRFWRFHAPPGTNRRHDGRVGVIFLAVWFSAMAACQPPSATQHTPELVGVVARVEPGPGPQRVTLADGRELSIALPDYEVIVGSGLPGPNDLLLTGTQPRPWLAGLSMAAAPVPNCYWLGGGGIEEGQFIASDRGLRLAKSADFDSGTWQPDQGRYRSNGFCVNQRGEVASVH